MPLNQSAAIPKARAWLALSAACLLACGPDKPEPKELSEEAPASRESPVEADMPDTSADTAVSPEAFPGRLAFSTRPPGSAFPGKPYSYRPALNRPGSFKLRILKADPAMRVDNAGRLTWIPAKEGREMVVLEAEMTGPGPEKGAKATQAFFLTVGKALILVMNPLPQQVDKDDSVAFDLRGSTYPAWAHSKVTVRFDYEGDGEWDTPNLPLAANLLHKYSYTRIGRFTPLVEARHGEFEIRTVEGTLSVVSAVSAVLRMSPDTLEPGERVLIDASGSKGDGRLLYSLDLDGDGKTDWADSATGKTAIKAPRSGLYQSVLTVRNPMGQEGRITAPLRVNARPRLDIKARNPRENMASEVEIKARAFDADDSLAVVRVNYTGAPEGWSVRTAVPDSVAGPNEWWLRFRHAYGKPGKYTASVCVAAVNGREACRTAAIEIYNAKPKCLPGPDMRATVGIPVEIDGNGEDPDGKIVKWEWDLDGDGKPDLVSEENGRFLYTFAKEGVFPLVLKVTTADGMTATGTRKVEVRKKWKT